MECSLPGSSIHGVFQARVREWVAIAFSSPIYCFSKLNVYREFGFFISLSLGQVGGGGLVAKSCPTLVTHGTQSARLLCPWDFPGKKYWSRLLFPSPGDLPDPGIKPAYPALKVDSYYWATKEAHLGQNQSLIHSGMS